MRVCDVVINSIWHDPRVTKQLKEYGKFAEVFAVGFKCDRYNADEIEKLICPVELVSIDDKYYRKKRTIFTKIRRTILENYRIYRSIVKTKADLIHANDLNALIPSYFAARKLKGKLVYDSHEIFVENNNLMRKPLAKKFYKRIEQYMAKRCDLMISVSNVAAEYFQKIYGIERPLVVTNCVSSDRIAMAEGVKKNEKFEVLNHGQFYPGRGYDVMAKAAPLLREYEDVELVIRGYGKQEREIRDILEENGAKNFRIDGPVNVSELVSCAAKSMVGVAVTEGICVNFVYSVSNKIFEYAAAGLPVIMSDIPEHRYLNGKYNFGIILKENTPECFAEAVGRLYNDKDFYESCAMGSRKLTEELNWEREFEKLLDAERKLIECKRKK